MGPQRYASIGAFDGAEYDGLDEWSGRGDSNPRLQLGKLSYYPYTTAAQNSQFITWAYSGDKIAGRAPCRRLERAPYRTRAIAKNCLSAKPADASELGALARILPPAISSAG